MTDRSAYFAAYYARNRARKLAYNAARRPAMLPWWRGYYAAQAPAIKLARAIRAPLWYARALLEYQLRNER